MMPRHCFWRSFRHLGGAGGDETEPPCVTLKMGSLSRTAFHVEDGEGVRSYQCSTTAEVNLYTRGKPVTEEKGATGNCINTATADLMEFSGFLESEAMLDFSQAAT